MNVNFEEIQISLPEDVREALVGKKAIVTGGTGMIGREVVRLLVEAGCEVTSISLDDLQLHPKAKYVKGDLSSLEFCLDISNGVD
jgi:GDP-L-fucose synthase